MPMSFDGLAANTSGWSIGPRARGTGSIGCAARIQHSLPIGHYATATAEHREPYESRGSRTVLGAPGGESPPGDSTWAAVRHNARMLQHCLSKQTLCRRDCGPLECQKPTMVDANDLPPTRPECLSRLAPRRGYLAGIS